MTAVIATNQLTDIQQASVQTPSASVFHMLAQDLLCQERILRFADHALRSAFFDYVDELSFEVDVEALRVIPPADRLNVTIRCDGKIRGSMSAPGENLCMQIWNAVERTLKDSRFGGALTFSEIDRASIEVWIQLSRMRIPHKDKTIRNCLQLGVDGLEIEFDGRRAYYKPSVAITSGFRSPQQMFAALCKKAGVSEIAWSDPQAILVRTNWACFLKDSQTLMPTRLRGLRRESEPRLNLQIINHWLKDCCNYMRANQFSQGDIAYVYRPFENEVSKEPINMVRAAGCLYSLSVAATVSDKEVCEVAAVTAKHLTRFILSHTLELPQGLVVSDVNPLKRPKLGSAALTAAALSLPILRNSFPDEARGFLNAVRSAQNSQGRFATHFGSDEEQQTSINFFPGQALLALVLNLEVDNVREQCRSAFIPYRDHFRKMPTTAFVGWQIDVWARLAILLNSEEYAQFVFEQCDWLLTMQVRDASLGEDCMGGFSRNGQAPNFSTIVFTEAILRALQLACFEGGVHRLNSYRSAAQAGLSFCARLRLDVTPSSFFACPDRTRGGIAMDLSNKNVRCDVVQHFITMCAAAKDAAECLFN